MFFHRAPMRSRIYALLEGFDEVRTDLRIVVSDVAIGTSFHPFEKHLFHLTPGQNHQSTECENQCRVAQGIEHDADEAATEELLRGLLDPEGTKVIRKYEVDEIDREGQTAEGADRLRCPRWYLREHQDEGAEGDGLQTTEHPVPAGVVVTVIQCSDVLAHL